ncbi:hypothetical protein LXA43DRAFT_997428 [Ganoderma leucocontextum]|nr:hypothetical protein LXA43DRAFT_997428 [Ganoderma leucocontextum]
MARSSRSSRPAARPTPAPAASQQTRTAHTAAAPHPATAPHPSQAPAVPPQAQAATQSSGPGMLAQMAATAGSVAVGSTIGHGLSSMLFGGSSSTPAAPEAPAAPVQQQHQQGISCDFQAKEFTKCLESADVNACSWYLEQLKACQAAAARY